MHVGCRAGVFFIYLVNFRSVCINWRAGRRKNWRRCKRSSQWTLWKPWVLIEQSRTRLRETGHVSITSAVIYNDMLAIAYSCIYYMFSPAVLSRICVFSSLKLNTVIITNQTLCVQRHFGLKTRGPFSRTDTEDDGFWPPFRLQLPCPCFGC